MDIHKIDKRVLITGGAGFIGTNLAKALTRNRNTRVVALDNFEPYYPRWIKERNLNPLKQRRNFSFIEGDLLREDLPKLLREKNDNGAYDYIFHLAARPGVRKSWDSEFEDAYVPNNVIATKKLLQAAVDLPNLKRFVYASSSSIYGDGIGRKFEETMLPRPLSPYGITKRDAEDLCLAFYAGQKVPTVSLRYFSVYGPGHRPDMAFHKFTLSILAGKPIEVHRVGPDIKKDGQARDFTYVGDVVQANLLACFAPAGEVFNVGGGAVIPLQLAISIIEELTGKKAEVIETDNPKGNVNYTEADLTKARQVLDYEPQTDIRQGLAAEVRYIRWLYRGRSYKTFA